MNLVLGARGRLGAALCRALGNTSAAERVLAPARASYEGWWAPDSGAAITAFMQRQPQPVRTVFVAAGVVDPQAPDEAHARVNLLLPQQLIQACVPLGIRVVSFGSTMETLLREAPDQGYAASKIALGHFVAQQAQHHGLALHLRLHTLYGGGPPAPFMFAGQMLQALRSRTAFRMSPGTQLREYHHVDDEAPAILRLAASPERGVLALNHGAAMSLAELARCTFAAFDALDLLQIGALPAPANERTGLRFERTPLLMTHPFRDVRSALADDLRTYL